MIGQQKNRTLYHPNYSLIERSHHFSKSRCVSELFWNFLKNTNAQVLFSFFQSSRYVSNEQLCLKITGLYDDLILLSSLLHFFYFIFRAPISFNLCFPISPSLFFVVVVLMFFLKPLSRVVEKLLYTYIYIYIKCV